MGQGYSLTTLSAGSAGIDVPELADIAHERSLGDARFMKAIRGKHRHGVVVVKVVMKPYTSLKFEKYIKHITCEQMVSEITNQAVERKRLLDVPNALPYHRAFETSSNGFLVRQYIHSSLYDRISTRPFLEDIEKRWLAFQLLSVVRDCHARKVYHGDIKTENTLVTSWNWLYLTDFSAAYKPTYLPEDNPAEFSFYFDIAGRRTCYLAPERFRNTSDDLDESAPLTWAMDIFSAGCVIAEIFLETPIFNLSQLLKYRNGLYDPETLNISRIEDPDVRDLITHMIKLEPESRYSADEYLNFWRNKTFPEYFYSFLHQYMHLITDPSSGTKPLRIEEGNNGLSDDRIDRVYTDYDKIDYFLGTDVYHDNTSMRFRQDDVFPLYLDVPNKLRRAQARVVTHDEGSLLFLSIVTSSIRSTARTRSRVRACDLLLVFSETLTDDARLDRVLPYLITLLPDASDVVKATALRAVAQLLSMISVTSPINSYLFPEYILPKLEIFAGPISRRPSTSVRATYATCLAPLAASASRFLDVSRVLRAEGIISTVDPDADTSTLTAPQVQTYDSVRAELVRFFESHAKALLTDHDAEVRRAFLGSTAQLCVFFGSVKTNDIILSHLNTYLNDRDWRLKNTLFEIIVGVAIFVGGRNLEEFILPLLKQALSDPEEFVTEKVLRSLSSMASLGLFQRSVTWELVQTLGCFCIHPNSWIRDAATSFFVASSKYVSLADRECLLYPQLAPYLRLQPQRPTQCDLLGALRSPLSRQLLEMAAIWAASSTTSTFWQQQQTVRSTELSFLKSILRERANANAKVPKDEIDEQWSKRLRNAGMTTEDELKLLALREHIYRTIKRASAFQKKPTDELLSRIIQLSTLGIAPETVFFDHQNHVVDGLSKSGEASHSQTIQDALQDASGPGQLISDELGLDALAPSSAIESIGSPNPSMPPPESSHASSAGTPNTQLRKHDPGVLTGTRHEHVLRHNRSAIDLISGKQKAKAIAETSTTSTNAVGKIDAQFSPLSHPAPTPYNRAKAQKRETGRFQSSHNYSGHDPNVLRLLDNVYLDSFPMDRLEYGPKVGLPIRKSDVGNETKSWSPEGKMIVALEEHTGAIIRILPSPDHLFFLTASTDGTVRIWDTSRLEKNLINKPRQIYHLGENVRATSVCFIDDTHTFVATGSDGHVHVVKVDCSPIAQGGVKYGKLKVLRKLQVPENAHAVWCEHYRIEATSILLLATSNCKIVAFDLRSTEITFVLNNDVAYGLPTCFCLSQDKHWVLIGTSYGCMVLWDLRFHLRLKCWRIPDCGAVHRLELYSTSSFDDRGPLQQSAKRRLVCAIGGTAGDATIWDIETGTCFSVYRVHMPGLKVSNLETLRRYTLIDLDKPQSATALSQLTDSMSEASAQPEHNETSMRSLTLGNFTVMDKDKMTAPFFITAGPDAHVRFWDLTDITKSCLINGPATVLDTQMIGARSSNSSFAKVDSGTPFPVYEHELHIAGDQQISPSLVKADETRRSETTDSRTRANIGTKRPVPASMVVADSGASSEARASSSSKQTLSPRQSTAPSGSRRTPKPRPTVISETQERLLRSHLDTVLDVCVLRYPRWMVVSGDRSGTVFVFA